MPRDPTTEEAWQELAWWASQTNRPKPPTLIPGLPGVNALLMQRYREQLVAWKVGKAEALMHGIQEKP